MIKSSEHQHLETLSELCECQMSDYVLLLDDEWQRTPPHRHAVGGYASNTRMCSRKNGEE